MASSTSPIPGPVQGGGESLAARLEALRSQVAAMAGSLWETRQAGELVEVVAAVESLKATVDAWELQLLAHLDAASDLKSLGWASTGDFATTVSGGHRRHGPALVRLAKHLGEPCYTPVAEALADGWLSAAKAQVVVAAVEALPGTCDHALAVQVMLEHAKSLDATALTAAGRHLLRVVDPDGEDRRDEKALEADERAAHTHRHLAITNDGAGGAWIKGRCAAEDAALIRATLMALAAPRPAATPTCTPEDCQIPGCAHDGTDPRDHGTRILDALVELCTRAQTTPALLPTQHGATPRISITISLADLLGGLIGLTGLTQRDLLGFAVDPYGHAVTDDGQRLSVDAVRRLACDAGIIPVILGHGPSEILDVGRQQRLVTPGQWRALVARDHHCRFPGCTRPPLMCHAHHVTHWLDGGPTNLDNLILLCSHHHRLIHHTPWTIHPRPHGGFTFHPPPEHARRRTPRGTHPPPPPRRE